MLNIQYYIQILRKNKFIILSITLVFTALSIFLTSPSIFPPLYEASAVLYPLNMSRCPQKDSLQNATVNPCYRTKRMLSSNNLKTDIIQQINSGNKFTEYSKSKLCANNYEKRVQYYENREHCIVLKVYDESPERALQMVEFIMNYIDSCTLALHSTQLERDSGFYEIPPLEKLQSQEDEAHKHLLNNKFEKKHLFTFDVISAPQASYVPTYPKRMKVMVSILVCSFIFSSTGCFLWNGMLHLKAKNR